MRPTRHRPGAFRTPKLRCLQRGTEACPERRQPSSPLLRREAEGAFVSVCERMGPTSFRDDSIPEAPLLATRCFAGFSSANGARFFLHERDFSAWPSWLEACELA